jgi:raffinose/stachyose/melibiose transport system substrate-binding protein
LTSAGRGDGSACTAAKGAVGSRGHEGKTGSPSHPEAARHGGAIGTGRRGRLEEEEGVQADRSGSRLRLLALGLAALAAALVVAACGGDSGASGGGSGEKVTINLLVGQPESTRDDFNQKRDIQEFNDSQDKVEVNRESMDNDQLRTILKTRLNSNNGPDIFSYDTGPGFGGTLAKAGLVAPLDKYYDKYNWPIYDWARARATYGGKTYAIPDQVEEVGLFYNTSLLKKLGYAQPPKTVDELEAMADKAKAQGLIPLAFADKDQWPAGHQFSMMVSNLLGRKGLDDILYGNGSWDSPPVVKGIDLYFKQFAQKGYFPKGVNGLSYDDGNALFYQQKAVAVPTGTWLVSDITQKASFPVTFAPFPSIDGSPISPPAGVGGGYFVSAKTKHMPQVMEYLNWWMSKQQAQHRIETYNQIPAFSVDTSSLKVTPLFKQVLTSLSKSEDPSAFGYNIDVLTPENFNDVMSTGFQDVLNGGRTPQQQAADLEAAWKKAKKSGDILKR